MILFSSIKNLYGNKLAEKKKNFLIECTLFTIKKNS